MKPVSCLIGHTGFVGTNLKAQHQFDVLVNSSNFEEIKGQSFQLVVCAGAYARKWYANQHPEEDREHIETLIGLLKSIKAERLLLISTIDVYTAGTAAAGGANEDFDCALQENHAYGTNRLALETAVASTFDSYSIVRLPGLFGPGLKKNVIFDLINQNCLSQINLASSFQYFDLRQLQSFISTVLSERLRLVNIFTEPIATEEIVRRFFPESAESCFRDESKAAHYDLRTKFDRTFGGSGGYVQSKAQLLEQLESYIKLEGASEQEAGGIKHSLEPAARS
jgi:hypothetical protein